MIAILAHDNRAAVALAKLLELRPSLLRFVQDERDVNGLGEGDTLLLWGHWWRNRHGREALHEAKLRKVQVLEVSDEHSR